MGDGVLKTPGGAHTVCSIGNDPQPKRPLVVSEKVALVSHGWLKRMYGCGHKDWKRFTLTIWGVEVTGTTEYVLCSNCLLKMLQRQSIRCGVCQRAILPGQPVVLYAFDPKLFDPARVTLHKQSVIGCYWADCCPNIGFLAGHWSEEGFLPMFPEDRSAVEQCG